MNAEVERRILEELTSLRSQVAELRRRETPVSAVATSDGRVYRRSLQDKVAERVSLTDFGAIADGVTDVGIALSEAMAVVPPGTILEVPATAPGASYFWSSTVDWTKAGITLDARPATFQISTGGKIKVNADRGTILGGTWVHTPAVGLQSSGLMLAVKNPTLGDSTGHHAGWKFRDCVFHNISLRFTKIGRTNVRIPMLYSTTTETLDTMQTDVTVVSVAPYTVGKKVGILNDGDAAAGVAPFTDLRTITAIDVGTATLTIDSPISYPVGTTGRRVTVLTTVVGAHAAGAATLNVQDTTIFTVGGYASIVQSDNRAMASGVLSINPGVSIQLDTPLTLGCAGGERVVPVNDGITSTGTDIASDSEIIGCEFRHIRTNYACELAGVRNIVVERNWFHDIVRYRSPFDARYGTQALPAYADIDPNYGECLKITAGAGPIQVLSNTFERWARNAIDLYAGGSGDITKNLFRDSIQWPAIESKWSSADLTPPAPIQVTANRFLNIPSYAIIAGTPSAVVANNTIENCYHGIYINGARNALVDDETGEVVNSTEDVVVSANLITRLNNLGTGIMVTEVTKAVVVGNTVIGGSYGIALYDKSRQCTVVANICRQQTTTECIRLRGHATTESRHTLGGNIVDSPASAVNLDSLSTYCVVNNYGVEMGLAVGAEPTLAKWSQGNWIKNDVDGQIFLHTGDAWIKAAHGTATSRRKHTHSGVTGWDGAADVSTDKAAGRFTVNALDPAWGLPTTVKPRAVTIHLRGRWAAASSGSTAYIAETGSTFQQGTIQGTTANNDVSTVATVALDASGTFDVVVTGATMNRANLRITGYWI